MVNDVTVPAPPVIEAEVEARRCAVARLLEARAAGRAVSQLIGPTATALGVSPRTLWRWLDVGLPGGQLSRAWQPSEADIDCYLRWKGNAAAHLRTPRPDPRHRPRALLAEADEQPPLTQPGRSDKILAHPLTQLLRTH